MKSKLTGGSASDEQLERVARGGREVAKTRADEQVARTLERQHADAGARIRAAPRIREHISRDRAQLDRVRAERGRALASSDTRRAAELGHRGERIEGKIAHAERELSGARRVVEHGGRAERTGGRPFTNERVQEQARFLDAQAELAPATRPRSAVPDGLPRGRDYAALAGLAGYGREEYEGLGAGPQRVARLEIDRELAFRRELSETAATVADGAATSKLGGRTRRRATRDFDSALAQRMREGGHRMPVSRTPRSQLDAWREQGARRPAGENDSSVMRDARELAARRRRQLGGGRR
jgi:hypothetical protein